RQPSIVESRRVDFTTRYLIPDLIEESGVTLERIEGRHHRHCGNERAESHQTVYSVSIGRPPICALEAPGQYSKSQAGEETQAKECRLPEIDCQNDGSDNNGHRYAGQIDIK